MESSLKVTDTPTESNFTDIMAGDNVINIPLFQREYKWTKKNLEQFWDDIQAIQDGSKKSQFLGVVVTVPQPKPMGVPPINDVVDGQQRLFTCYLAVLAAVETALDLKEKTWALEVARSYLLLRRHSSYPYNTKIVPSAADRKQFHKAWYNVTHHSHLDPESDWREIGVPTPPPPSGNHKGKLEKQYGKLKSKLSQIARQGGLPAVQAVVEIIVNSLSFVTISLKDPIVAPIIFERLNSRGEKITTADLVRNEIFSQIAHDADAAQTLFDSYWRPFQGSFDDRNVNLETLLFPYGLCINQNITKAELFVKLRDHWSSMDAPETVIKDMDRFSPTLFCLEKGEVSAQIPEGLRENLLRLHRSNLPSSIYSFIFKCVDRVRSGSQNAEDVADAFSAVEAFLVRRAVCGFEPSGLHAVFKGMFDEITDSDRPVSAVGVAQAIKRRTTVPWPDDDAFVAAIKGYGMYKRRICRFIMMELEASAGAEKSEDNFWIEHVLPQTLNANWNDKFNVDEHKKYVNTLANLVPLTSTMNGVEGTNSYSKKNKAFAGSKFSSTRDFAAQYPDWTPSLLERRGVELADWAKKRWPKF